MRQIEDRVPDGTDDCCRQAYSEGVESVLYIRCMKHREIRQLNEKEERGECPVCQIETLLSHGQPGFHVLRLVGNGDISAGKGRELLIDVLLGKIGLGDLPMFNAGGVEVPHEKGKTWG